VDGLTKDDFVLYDNGKKQTIAMFEKSRRSLPKTPQAVAVAPPRTEFTNRPAGARADQGNAIIVVWDALNTNVSDQIRARKALVKALGVIRPGDHVGVYILGSSINVLQDFTSDSERLAETLEKYTAWPDIGYLPAPQKRELTQRAVWQIRNRMAHISGRKSVIWVAGGASGYLYGADFKLYIVDVRGIEGFPEIRAENSSIDEAAPFSWGPALFNWEKKMAASTGGVAFTHDNDIRRAIDKAMTDGDLSYTLGFYAPVLDERDAPPNSRDYSARNKFFLHALKVEIKRRGVNARYRQSYQTVPYEPPPERRLNDAVDSPIDSTQIAISAQLAANNSSPHIAVVVNDVVLAAKDGRWTGAVDLVVAQRAANGAQLTVARRSLALDVDPQNYETFLAQGLKVTLELAPKAGMSEIKIAVLDRTSGRVGSLTIPVRHE